MNRTTKACIIRNRLLTPGQYSWTFDNMPDANSISTHGDKWMASVTSRNLYDSTPLAHYDTSEEFLVECRRFHHNHMITIDTNDSGTVMAFRCDRNDVRLVRFAPGGWETLFGIPAHFVRSA